MGRAEAVTEAPGSYAALEERVSGIERQMATFSVSIDTLAKEIRDRGRIPWGAATFALGVVSVLAAIISFAFMAYISSINGGIAGLQNQISTLVQNTLPAAQLDERYEQTERRLSTIEGGLVTRGEHQSQWENLKAADADLQRQMDLLRADVGSSFTLNDALSEMAERIARLEELRLQQSVPAQRSPAVTTP